MKFIKVGDSTFNVNRIIEVSKPSTKNVRVVYDVEGSTSVMSFETGTKCDEFYNELSNKLTSLKSE